MIDRDVKIVQAFDADAMYYEGIVELSAYRVENSDMWEVEISTSSPSEGFLRKCQLWN